ncbi:hypothetical protein [Halobaculum sp. D14]|uniref:hypothetical protein n=1 Tax=Halobaculum sp. D14 TaxID=3421642 RepID=UPI003EBBB3A2
MSEANELIELFEECEEETSQQLTPNAPPTHGTESFPQEIPWKFLFRLAGTPSDAEFSTTELSESTSNERLLRELPDERVAPATELGKLLGARTGLEGPALWENYHGAEMQGYFHEVREVAVLAENPPESPESDATEW